MKVVPAQLQFCGDNFMSVLYNMWISQSGTKGVYNIVSVKTDIHDF